MRVARSGLVSYMECAKWSTCTHIKAAIVAVAKPHNLDGDDPRIHPDTHLRNLRHMQG